jgi:hypothetical protein
MLSCKAYSGLVGVIQTRKKKREGQGDQGGGGTIAGDSEKVVLQAPQTQHH